MADRKRWFKLWVSICTDPQMKELPLDAIARFALLGAYIADHGTSGTLTVPGEAKGLCELLRVPDAVTARALLTMLPNVRVDEAKTHYGMFTVTLSNWRKYQEDTTVAERMRALRSKRRGEEKRVLPPIVPLSGGAPMASNGMPKGRSRPATPNRKATSALDPDFVRFWQDYPRKVAKTRAEAVWAAAMPTPALARTILDALAHHAAFWRRHGTPLDKIPHPATWLHQRRWEDQLGDTTSEDPYAHFPRG